MAGLVKGPLGRGGSAVEREGGLGDWGGERKKRKVERFR